METRTVNPSSNVADYPLPELKHLAVGSGRLAYREAGEGQPVLFLHGMNGQSGSWYHQFNALSEKYRVIAWDAPGYGSSTPCRGDIGDLAAIAFELVDRIRAEQPLVVGHSMGGVIAGRLAIDHPAEILGLVLSCSHGGWADTPGRPLRSRYLKRLEELRSMSPPEYAALRASKMVSSRTDPAVREFLAAMSEAITPAAMETVGRANQEANNLPRLAKLDIPVIVLQAEHDTVIKPDRTEAMLEQLPNARRIELKGVGHAPYVEDPDGYSRTIEQIVTELTE